MSTEASKWSPVKSHSCVCVCAVRALKTLVRISRIFAGNDGEQEPQPLTSKLLLRLVKNVTSFLNRDPPSPVLCFCGIMESVC